MSWDELVAAALIGTDRRPVEPSAPPGSPAGLADALAGRGPEERLLASAAAWTVARRAGARAGAPVTVAPAELDERPLPSTAAGDRLRMLLEDDEEELIGLWLARAREIGVRPPPEHVPSLLELATRRPELQDAVAAASGPLGSWLSERELGWAFARTEDDTALVWSDGSRAQRRLLLARLRRTDPNAARELVERTFADEPWEDRVAFVELLERNLSDADEPFLEQAHQDGRQPVREAAANLLARLPGSRYAHRAAEEARVLLRVENGVLIATLPEARGRRSERLTALLAAAPLSTWDLELVGLPVADDLGPAVYLGWTAAAYHQRNEDWARELWRVVDDPRLLSVLPRQEAERRALGADDPFAAALELPGPWGPLLSRKVLELVPKLKDRGVRVAAAGYRLDPSLEPEVEALRDLGGRDVLDLCDTVATRAAILRELA